MINHHLPAKFISYIRNILYWSDSASAYSFFHAVDLLHHQPIIFWGAFVFSQVVRDLHMEIILLIIVDKMSVVIFFSYYYYYYYHYYFIFFFCILSFFHIKISLLKNLLYKISVYFFFSLHDLLLPFLDFPFYSKFLKFMKIIMCENLWCNLKLVDTKVFDPVQIL